MQVLIALRRGVSEEGQIRRVACDVATALDHFCGPLLDGVRQIGSAIETVDAMRQRVAMFEIGSLSCANRATGNAALLRSSLDAGKRLANVEAERHVERQRAIVKRGLYEPDAGGALLLRAIENGAHQLATDTEILRRWIDRDRPEPMNDRAFVEAIASDNPAADLGDDAIKTGCREKRRQHADAGLDCGKIRWEVVRGADGVERVEANLSGDGSVICRSDADGYIGAVLGHGGVMVANLGPSVCSNR